MLEGLKKCKAGLYEVDLKSHELSQNQLSLVDYVVQAKDLLCTFTNHVLYRHCRKTMPNVNKYWCRGTAPVTHPPLRSLRDLIHIIKNR